jgi:rhamnosyltransferase
MSTNKKLFENSKYGLPLNLPNNAKKISFKEKVDFNFTILKECTQNLIDNKVALFAHYDPDYIIDEYVTHYINEIYKLGYTIIFITTNKLKYNDDLQSLNSIIVREGEGYDFTNWACAFSAYPELFSANEILLCNDSVFGPINPLKPIHDLMDSKDCDFWGLSDNKEIIPHIQSYYLVLKKNAIQSEHFKQLFSYNYVKTRKDAINIEVNLTSFLSREGLKPFSYISSSQIPITNINYVQFFWEPLIKWCSFPILKRNLLTENIPWIDSTAWKTLLLEKKYNINLILNYFKRINVI